LDKRYETLQEQLLLWTDNQKNMEKEELVRMLVVNRIATNYQLSIQRHAFERWAYVVQRRKNQRNGLHNILDRLVEPSGTAHKRQLMQIWQLHALADKHDRLRKEKKTIIQEHTRLRLKLRELKDQIESTVTETTELVTSIEETKRHLKHTTTSLDLTQLQIIEYKNSPEIPKMKVVIDIFIKTLNYL
jgi:predicted  nucleic acid-binding Zn-ribbon protein